MSQCDIHEDTIVEITMRGGDNNATKKYAIHSWILSILFKGNHYGFEKKKTLHFKNISSAQLDTFESFLAFIYNDHYRRIKYPNPLANIYNVNEGDNLDLVRLFLLMLTGNKDAPRIMAMNYFTRDLHGELSEKPMTFSNDNIMGILSLKHIGRMIKEQGPAIRRNCIVFRESDDVNSEIVVMYKYALECKFPFFYAKRSFDEKSKKLDNDDEDEDEEHESSLYVDYPIKIIRFMCMCCVVEHGALKEMEMDPFEMIGCLQLAEEWENATWFSSIFIKYMNDIIEGDNTDHKVTLLRLLNTTEVLCVRNVQYFFKYMLSRFSKIFDKEKLMILALTHLDVETLKEAIQTKTNTKKRKEIPPSSDEDASPKEKKKKLQ